MKDRKIILKKEGKRKIIFTKVIQLLKTCSVSSKKQRDKKSNNNKMNMLTK